MRHTLYMPVRKHKRTLNTSKDRYQPHSVLKAGLTVFCIYSAYLIVLPLITAQIVPCLANHPFVSYESKDCSVEQGLDTYMRLAIAGLSVLTLGFLLFMRRYLKLKPFHTFEQWKKIPSQKTVLQEFIPVMVVALAMAIATVIAYLLFLPSVEHAVRNAPILLGAMK